MFQCKKVVVRIDRLVHLHTYFITQQIYLESLGRHDNYMLYITIPFYSRMFELYFAACGLILHDEDQMGGDN